VLQNDLLHQFVSVCNAKNYETVFKFVKVILEILWPFEMTELYLVF